MTTATAMAVLIIKTFLSVIAALISFAFSVIIKKPTFIRVGNFNDDW